MYHSKKSACKPSGPSARRNPSFCTCMKQLGIFLHLLDRMLVHGRVTPSIKFANTHLYTWVVRSTVRVKCLAQQHRPMSPPRAQTRTAWCCCMRLQHPATCFTDSTLKGQCHEDFAVLGQFWAKMITLRL